MCGVSSRVLCNCNDQTVIAALNHCYSLLHCHLFLEAHLSCHLTVTQYLNHLVDDVSCDHAAKFWLRLLRCFARLHVLFTDPHPGFHHRPQEQSFSPVITPSFQSPNGHHSSCINRLPLQEFWLRHPLSTFQEEPLMRYTTSALTKV